MDAIQYENKLVVSNLALKLICMLVNGYFDFNKTIDTMVFQKNHIPKLKIINNVITAGKLDNRKITNDAETLGIYFEIIKNVLNVTRDRFNELCLNFLENHQYPDDNTYLNSANMFKRVTNVVEEMCIFHKEDKRLIYCEPDDDKITMLYKKTLDTGVKIILVS